MNKSQSEVVITLYHKILRIHHLCSRISHRRISPCRCKCPRCIRFDWANIVLPWSISADLHRMCRSPSNRNRRRTANRLVYISACIGICSDHFRIARPCIQPHQSDRCNRIWNHNASPPECTCRPYIETMTQDNHGLFTLMCAKNGKEKPTVIKIEYRMMSNGQTFLLDAFIAFKVNLVQCTEANHPKSKITHHHLPTVWMDLVNLLWMYTYSETPDDEPYYHSNIKATDRNDRHAARYKMLHRISVMFVGSVSA